MCSARGQGIGHQSFDDRGLGISWPPTLLLAFIHRSAWNRYSRKYICKILHNHTPVPHEITPPDIPHSPTH